jgi:acetyltransferase
MIEYSSMKVFKTKTGLPIHVRSLLPQDAPYLVDLFENMSAQSRYQRFLQSVDQIGMERIWTEAENIAHGATGDTHGWVAFGDLAERVEAPVAAARYVKLSATQAEIAVSVRDDMQNIGIGTYLLRLLIADAAENGIDQLVGVVRNDNTAMWLILKKLGCRLEQRAEGSYSLIALYVNEAHLNEMERRWEEGPDVAADFSPEPQIIW